MALAKTYLLRSGRWLRALLPIGWKTPRFSAWCENANQEEAEHDDVLSVNACSSLAPRKCREVVLDWKYELEI